MKKIVILLEEETQDYKAGYFIKENIHEVLGDTVNVEVFFLPDMKKVDFSTTDLFIITVPNLLHRIYEYLQVGYNKEKMLLVSRTLSRDALTEINKIPAGERVLVVNRLRETTADLIKLLYELEIIHLDFVPYEPDIDLNQFKHIVTVGKLNVLSDCDAKIIDIGFRQLGTQAFLDIFSRLDIWDERLRQNLSRYIQKLPSKYNDVEKRYLQAQMTDKTLEKVVEKSEFGILVTDMGRRVLYRNEKANAMFQANILPHERFEALADPAIAEKLFGADFRNELLKVGEEYIMVERHQLMNGDDSIGFYFECQTAKSIRSMDNKLSEKLRKSGFYAKYKFEDIVYFSHEMQQCLEAARKLAKTNYSILIAGESGSGKEMFAQSIHNASERSSGPFVAVNCAAFPEALLESELFGYEGGSFTGSKRDGKMGLFELANKGSVFLDEIGDMPFSLQAKLLRALQEKKIMRVGSNHVVDIDIRVLSASNKDLREEIEQKRFRADLYYRLSTFTISIPPLRNRREDILPLFHTFSSCHDKPLRIDDEQRLLNYRWPGNVRELQNVAAYYDVIGTIGSIPSEPESRPEAAHAQKQESKLELDQTCKIISYSEAKNQIIAILARYSDVGLGRGRLLALLKSEGVLLSENRFELLVKELLQEQIIVRGKGRAGIRLTDKALRGLFE